MWRALVISTGILYAACSDAPATTASGDVGAVVEADATAGTDIGPTGDLATPGSGAELCEGVVCTPLDDCHVAGSCDPSTGECTHPPLPDGTVCSDGDECTRVDRCIVGGCVGAESVVCAGEGPCAYAGTCEPATGSCVAVARADGTLCDDGSACSLEDRCLGGACLGTSAVVCPALGPCHAPSVCDPGSGACAPVLLEDGAACDDGDACTTSDTCQEGACVGDEPVTCLEPNPCLRAGVCDPETGVCSGSTLNDGAVCDDGSACTLADLCSGGACVGTAAVECPSAGPCYEAPSCDLGTGECLAPVPADGQSCDDGDACTVNDVCSAGACVASEIVECPADGDCRSAGECDHETGECTSPPLPDGTSCSDGDLCSAGDRCIAGACEAVGPVPCPALGPCMDVGTCDPLTGACSAPPLPNGTSCDDGDPCTVTSTCQAGSCVAELPVLCTAKDDCHEVGACDPATGLCSNPVRANGSTCDDGSACTVGDTCSAGTCQGGAPVLCIAAGPCREPGSCDPASGVCSSPAKTDGAGCSDGDPCTLGDACSAGACAAGASKSCPAAGPCELPGACDPGTGQCTTPPKPDGSACDDGDACTPMDSCLAGQCNAGQPVLCIATGPCRLPGTCNPATGQCTNPARPDGAGCSDGDHCTTADSCNAGQCVGNSVVCTASSCRGAGSCSPATGTCSLGAPLPEGAPCSDGDACTRDDTCNASGTCLSGDVLECAAIDGCHEAGLCNPVTGECSSPALPDGTTCSDGDPCTTVDTCTSGKCVGSGCTAGILFEEDFENGCGSGCLADEYVGAAGAWQVQALGSNGACPNDFFVSEAESGNGPGQCGTAGGDASLHIGNQSCSPQAAFFCPSGDCGAAYDAGCSALFCDFGICECSEPGGGVIASRAARSPIIDASGTSNLTITFNYIEKGAAAADNADFEWFDGTSWTVVPLPKSATCPDGNGRWTAFSYTFPAGANGNAGLRIGFRWVNNGDGNGADPSFAVDDITITSGG